MLENEKKKEEKRGSKEEETGPAFAPGNLGKGDDM
jgi:hypothetical protein